MGKRIILSPEQLHRLLGRDRLLMERSDADKRAALEEARKKAPVIGPTQAYAHFAGAQERHLHHANVDRTTPLDMNIAGEKEEETKEKPKGETKQKKKRKVGPRYSPVKTRGQRKKEDWLHFGRQ